MKKIIQIIKSINIRQVATVFLAGCLLVVTTACSQGNTDGMATRQTSSTYQGEPRDTYDNYDANQNYKDDFNGYDDDRRYDSKTAAKAQTLVDTAKRRQADSMGDFVDNVVERSVADEDTNERALSKFTNKVERNKDKALDYVDNKSDKLQRNIEKAPRGAKNVFEGAVDTAQDAVEDATKATKKTTKNIKENFKDIEVDLS